MSITLPKVKSRKKIIQSFFGYDPIDGQYKVLCMSQKVFTLEGRRVKQSWKMIECNIIHRPVTNGVCINGVLYYGAFTGIDMKEWCLMRFYVRFEKFDQVVQILSDQSPPSLISYIPPTLMSYKGKVTLAIEVEQQRFELWVLEDTEKHEWS